MAQRIYILPGRDEESGWPAAPDVRRPRGRKPVAERAREVCRERAERAQEAFRRASRQFAGTARSSIKRIRRAAYERPFHLVAGIAGAAFVLGVALRIWRSKHHEE